MAFNENTIKDLKKKSNIVRRNIIEMIGINRSGHLGGSMSCVDIITCLYFYKMDITPENFNQLHRDRFILSKGHSVLAQYGALVELGFFYREELPKTKTINGILQGHPDRNKTFGIEINTGSLGQGLSVGCGMALAAKLNKMDDKTVYVIMGDAEIAEGEVWEAAMAASRYKLDNLVAVIDRNRLSSVGFIEERFNIPDLDDKFRSFGWDVYRANGHDMKELVDVFDKTDKREGKPKIVIAETVKGKGVDFAENNPKCHSASFTEKEYNSLMTKFTRLIEGD